MCNVLTCRRVYIKEAETLRRCLYSLTGVRSRVKCPQQSSHSPLDSLIPVMAEDLGTSIMVAVFRQVGTVACCSERLKMLVNTAASW